MGPRPKKKSVVKGIAKRAAKMDAFREKNKLRGTTCPAMQPKPLDEADKLHSRRLEG